MPDKSVTLANFKYGLDSRRADLASQPGTLAGCENGFINAGAEVEKRKAFYDAGIKFPENTFGLQDVQVGMETYYSDIGGPSGALPANVVGVYLPHPTAGWGGAYDATLHAMIGVMSCSAEGKSFVLATFSDGNTFAYFDGVLVGESAYGRVMQAGGDFRQLAADVALNVDLTNGWRAVPNSDGSAVAKDGTGVDTPGMTIIMSPAGVKFSMVDGRTGGPFNGVIGFKDIDVVGFDGKAAVGAIAKFKVTNGAAGDAFTVAAPASATGAPIVDLCTGIVQGATASDTATAIAKAINLRTFLTNYTADTLTDTVFIYAPVSFGASPNGWGALLEVITTGTASAAGSAATSSMTGSVDIPNDFVTKIGKAPTRLTSDLITAVGIGGVSPYTYLWAVDGAHGTVIGTGSGQWAVSSSTSAAVRFTGPLQSVNAIEVGYFQVTITDSAAHFVVVKVSVSLSYETLA